MASYEPVIKNGASGAIFYVALKPYTSTGRFQANPTLAAGDVTISIDGGAFANLATLPDAEPNSSKSVRVLLSQAETNGDNLVILFSDQTDPPEWIDAFVNIQTVAYNFDTLPAAVWATVLEGIYTAQAYMRLIASALLGKVSGMQTNSPVFRDTGDTTNRISATTDVYGNRSAVTLVSS